MVYVDYKMQVIKQVIRIICSEYPSLKFQLLVIVTSVTLESYKKAPQVRVKHFFYLTIIITLHSFGER